MTLQKQFDLTIDLLKTQGQAFPYSSKLVDSYQTGELTFDSFESPSSGTTKANLLGIYEIRAEIEEDRKDNPHVLGYDTLLPNFRLTNLEFICISSFTTRLGFFMVFSDFDRTELLGVLFSKTTLQQTRDNREKDKGKYLTYIQEENVFIDGLLQTQIHE